MKYSVWIFSVLVALVALAISLRTVNWNDCSDEIVSVAPSPDGSKVATVFHRNCGATAPFVTHVNLQPRYAKFNPDKGKSILVVEGEVTVGLDWKSNENLVLSPGSGGKVFRADSEWNGVKISVK